MQNNLIIDTNTLIQILKAQGLKTPGIIDLMIEEQDIDLDQLIFNVTVIINAEFANAMWIALEAQKMLYAKICSLIDQDKATVNVQIVLKEDTTDE